MKQPGNYIYEELFDRKNENVVSGNLIDDNSYSDLKAELIKKTEKYIEELK